MKKCVNISMDQELVALIYDLRMKDEYRRSTFSEIVRALIIAGLEEEGILPADK